MYRVATVGIAFFLLTACNVGVNKSIHIRDGEKVSHGQSTVNGSIYIGSHCRVSAGCSTVNGKIEVGSNSEVESLRTVNRGIRVGKDSVVDGSAVTVNGSIKLKEGVRVDGDIDTVNGNISCGKGVRIEGEVATVNGDVDIVNGIVKEDIKVNNGDITLSDESVLTGNIVIKRSGGFKLRTRKVAIRITGGSLVKGDILVKDSKTRVTVYLSNGGEVAGKIRGAEVVKE